MSNGYIDAPRSQNVDQPPKTEDFLPGAEPFFFGGRAGGPAAVCVHGFRASPHEMRPLGDALAACGFAVRGPAVAGHGLSPVERGLGLHRRITRDQWLASIRDEVLLLRESHPFVVGVGQSMGALLCIQLAAEGLLDALALTGAALVLPRFVRTTWRLLKHIDVVVPTGTRGEIPGNVIYPYYSSQAGYQLYRLSVEARRALPRVTCPLLACHSRRDQTITPGVIPILEREAGGPLEVIWFDHSEHTMPLGCEGPAVVATVAAWCSRHVMP
jgi:carboxylesterase